MAARRTSLSAGEIIRDILANDADVSARARKVYPVVEDSAELPYVVYRRAQSVQTPVKGAATGAESVSVEVMCYAAGYTESVELAEAVRAALDGASREIDGLRMRSCVMTDSEESWQDDAYLQDLVFELRINNVNY